MVATNKCVDEETLQRLGCAHLCGPEAAAIEAHLHRCPSCAAAFERQFEPIVAVLRTYKPAETPEDGEMIAGLISHLEARFGPAAASTVELDPVVTREQAAVLAVLAPPEEDDEIGRLGQYRITRILGEGGMAVVFAGRDPVLAREVAVKVIRPSRSGSAQHRERFLREARAVAALHHEHIVRVHAAGDEGGVPYLVMPLLKGETLAARLRLRRGPLPVGLALRLAREVAEGLAAAHAAGLVHRDIKPDNCWLEERADGPRVQILDFGLAALMSDEGRLTHEGLILGTPCYMAPEQATGGVDGRADLFSLGCVLYEMCTGDRAFSGAGAMATLSAVANTQPRTPREVNPAIPVAVSELVMTLLAKTPDARPATAEAVVRVIRGIEGGSPRRRGVSRLWWAASVLFGITIIIIRIDFGGSNPAPQPGPANRIPMPPRAAGALTGVNELGYIISKPGAIRDVVFTPDGEHVLSGGIDGVLRQWKYRKGPAQEVVEKALGEAGAIRQVLFSPTDSSRVVTIGPDFGPHLWDIRERKLLRKFKGSPEGLIHVAYSPDGKRIAAGGGAGTNDFRICVWDVDRVDPVKVLKGSEGFVTAIAWMPDGKRLISCAYRDTRKVRVWDVASGATLDGPELAPPQSDGWSLAITRDGKRLFVGTGRGDVVPFQTANWQPEPAWDPKVGRVSRILLTSDEKTVLVAGDGCRAYDAADGRLVTKIGEYIAEFRSMSLSPDGKYLLTMRRHGGTTLWKVTNSE